MKPQVKFGLICGGVGLVLNAIVSVIMGICGPAVTLLAGAVAGFLTGRATSAATKKEGAGAGAISGGIAGAIMIVSQVAAGLITLFIIQRSGTLPLGGEEAAYGIGFLAGGIGASLCFGLAGLILAALAGAGAAYLATQETPAQATPRLDAPGEDDTL